MWYNNKVTNKLIFVTVVMIMCMTAFMFGSGFGIAKNGVGTLNMTDANRFVVFSDKTQFDEYVASHEGDLFNIPASDRVSYDDKFFESQALVMFLTDGMSSSIKVSSMGYELVGNELHVKVKEMSPPIHTMDLHYNTLRIAVPQDIANKITKVVIDSHRIEM